MADTASEIRNNIQSGIDSMIDAVTPDGVLAVGFESTSVAGIVGQKGAEGFYVDFDNREFGSFVKSGTNITTVGDDLAAGMELQSAMTIDYSESMQKFTGIGYETGGSIGPLGFDISVTEGNGFSSIGIDLFSSGGGASVIKVTTAAIPLYRY